MRALLTCLLVVAACAHQPAEATAAPSPARPRQPMPVRVSVVGLKSGGNTLVGETEGRVRSRLESRGHQLDDAAPLTIEVAIDTVETRAGGKTCARLRGRLIRDGQRFSAVDEVKERCKSLVPGSWLPVGGSGSGLETAGYAVAAAVATAIQKNGSRDELGGLYLEAVDDLTDTLSMQASR